MISTGQKRLPEIGPRAVRGEHRAKMPRLRGHAGVIGFHQTRMEDAVLGTDGASMAVFLAIEQNEFLALSRAGPACACCPEECC
jgi:hypothetical protein